MSPVQSREVGAKDVILLHSFDDVFVFGILLIEPFVRISPVLVVPTPEEVEMLDTLNSLFVSPTRTSCHGWNQS